MNPQEYDFVIMAILDSVKEQQKQLSLAVNRRKRASVALAKADHDIAAISGALAALQDVARRLNMPDSEAKENGAGGAEPAPPPNKIYNTLAGPAEL